MLPLQSLVMQGFAHNVSAIQADGAPQTLIASAMPGTVSTCEAGCGSVLMAGLCGCMLTCPHVVIVPKQCAGNMKPVVSPCEGMQTADIRQASCMSSQCSTAGLVLSAQCVMELTVDCILII